jgi:hypothetical protein
MLAAGMSHRQPHPDGTATEIHYWKDRSSAELSGFKFKDHPDNPQSRRSLDPEVE